MTTYVIIELSDTNDNKSLWQSIVDYIKNIVHKDILVEETVNDVIGNNAKVVIFTLFGLLLATIIMYSVLLTGKYNPDSVWSETPLPINVSNIRVENLMEIPTLEKQVYMSILTNNTTDPGEKLDKIKKFNEAKIANFQERFQQIEQIDAVFIAAITGAVALGGTLITQLWARRQG